MDSSQMEHITMQIIGGYIQKGWLHKGSWYYLDQDGKWLQDWFL